MTQLNHGTATCYNYHKCRCELCKKANADRNLQYSKSYQHNNKEKVAKKRKQKLLDVPWERFMNSIWNRCYNPNHARYPRYGGIGIINLLTKEDLKFLWFRDKGYSMKRPSIDRINSSGNYELSNCQFLELSENSRKH